MTTKNATADQTETITNIAEFEDAAATRWLRQARAPARARAAQAPSAEAVDRIRARLAAEAPAGKRTLAA